MNVHCITLKPTVQHVLSYFAFYFIVLDPQIYVKTPSSMGSAYIECLTALCQQNDFRGMHCSSQIFYGLCGKHLP